MNVSAQAFGTSGLPEPTFENGERITIDGFLDRARRLAPMPAVVGELLALLNDERARTMDIARAIERDQAISAAVIRMANSAFYRGMNNITTMQGAITRMGLVAVRDLVLAAAVLRAPTKASPLLEQIRQHMLATAGCSRVIARYVDNLHPDTAFLAGLLLDMGRSIMALAAPEKYTALSEMAKDAGVPIERVEASWVGFTHAEVGAELAERWGFPSLITRIIEFQHRLPSLADADAREEYFYTAVCVLADTVSLALHKHLPPAAVTPDALAEHDAQQALHLPERVLGELVEECKFASFQLGAIFDG